MYRALYLGANENGFYTKVDGFAKLPEFVQYTTSQLSKHSSFTVSFIHLARQNMQVAFDEGVSLSE